MTPDDMGTECDRIAAILGADWWVSATCVSATCSSGASRSSVSIYAPSHRRVFHAGGKSWTDMFREAELHAREIVAHTDAGDLEYASWLREAA